jgi:L,D-peptidoglycan transpeptidase YkuD (ErfK/YbiS/YcfS/YnhG family)
MKKILILITVLSVMSLNARSNPAGLWKNLSSLGFAAGSSQAVLVVGDNRQGKGVIVYLFEKNEGTWRVLPKEFPAIIGKNGFAPIGEKKEGDGKTPTGMFPVSLAFGYAQIVDTAMPYRQATADDYWVDDSSSPLYNTWVKGKPDAKSMESMKRKDDLYKWGLVVDYNVDPVVKGKGSAIFIHVWRKPGSVTAGCAACAEENILYLLKWLDPAKKPVVAMGTYDDLEKLGTRGGL